MSLRVRLLADDGARRAALAAAVREAGHVLADEAPDVVLCDRGARSVEAEAPVLLLADHAPTGAPPAGLLPRDVSPETLDAALRAVAAGLVVRAPASGRDGFQAEEEPALLTPREAEILALVGRGMSNKAVARALGISVHTVKFHLEALFAKLEASSRAEAVAKGLRGGLIEL